MLNLTTLPLLEPLSSCRSYWYHPFRLNFRSPSPFFFPPSSPLDHTAKEPSYTIALTITYRLVASVGLAYSHFVPFTPLPLASPFLSKPMIAHGLSPSGPYRLLLKPALVLFMFKLATTTFYLTLLVTPTTSLFRELGEELMLLSP